MSLIEVIMTLPPMPLFARYSHDLIVSLIEVCVSGNGSLGQLGVPTYSHDLIVSLIEVISILRVASSMAPILTI